MDINYESENTGNTWPKRPFLTIWVQPKQTIRAIVNSDPTKYVLPLAALIGIATILYEFKSNSISLTIGNLALLLVVGPLLGICLLYVLGAILSTASAFVGGAGEQEVTRTAIAWGSIPNIASIPMYLIFLMLIAIQENFSIRLHIFLNTSAHLLLFLIWIWWFFVFTSCLAEIKKISFRKAVFVSLLSVIALMILGMTFDLLFEISQSILLSL